MSNERTVSQLQADNRSLTNNVRDLQRELDDTRRLNDELFEGKLFNLSKPGSSPLIINKTNASIK